MLPYFKQDNVQVNTESVQCISIAYSEVRITEISDQLSRVDHVKMKRSNFKIYLKQMFKL